MAVESELHRYLVISSDQRWMYLAGNQGQIDVIDLRDLDQPKLNARLKVPQSRTANGD